MTVKARFDGRVFIPEGPVDLPIGAVVEISDVQTESGSTPVNRGGSSP